MVREDIHERIFDNLERLGPWPEKVVAVFADLGLTDVEIARYFRVHRRLVERLRNAARLADRGNAGLTGRFHPAFQPPDVQVSREQE